ncbi:glycosyltransferase [Oceanimonas pelagia]|uniref:Glycosyltransferase n=1 Tax=Oceanimonas pelagia TaxID=3028314 RepID=A0AA50QAM8_9GAMM|nr:glycosyltransferase [Oceanimonas pelagia]WMC09221.1 glycosyltransferase [Oceanimonas pelagia]
MRIVIDMQGAQAENKNRGIGRYSLALVKGIIRHANKHEVILALNGDFEDSIIPIRATFQQELPQTAIRVWRPVTPATHIEPKNNWHRKTSEKLYEAFLKSLQPDAIIITSLFEGLTTNAVTSIGQYSDLPIAVVLYDLIPLINKTPYLDNPAVKKWYEEKIGFIRKANLLLSISDSSRNEALSYLNFSSDKVINISTDADPQFSIKKLNTEERKKIKDTYGIKKDLVLYTGGIDHRKNIEGLISAYSLLSKNIRSKHQLAIVCSISEAEKVRLENLAKKQGLDSNELLLTGFVPEDDLISLYNLCKVFVFPSWHEGFGLPVLEAMRCGAAVIGANTSSLPEVIGSQEALFDPHNIDSITSKLNQVLSDNELRNHLKQHAVKQAKSFSWERTAKITLMALEKHFMVDKGSSYCSRLLSIEKKPRMAYISPLPPERSGISDYSAELLPELKKYYNIDVVVEQKDISDKWVANNLNALTPSEFLENHHNYDRIIYHFGNSEFHAYMLKLIEHAPGVIVLHDFFLSGLMGYYSGYAEEPLYYIHSLYNSHGYQAVHRYFNNDDTAWIYPCNIKPLSTSKGLIVHSPFSKKLNNDWHGKTPSERIKVIPLLRTPANINVTERRMIRKALGIDEEAFLVCSFGMIGKSKFNHRLLKAWLASSLSKNKRSYLVFVGENDPGEYGKNLLSEIEDCGLGNRIKITGWASEKLFKQYLSVADIGVQLRGLTRGETSAAVLDCMNYGLPTIVNANGSMADLPDNAVLKLQDVFDDVELTEALEHLWENHLTRERLGDTALNIIKRYHSPSHCGNMYAEAIEDFYKNGPVNHVDIIKSITPPEDQLDVNSALKSLASSIDYAIPLSIEKPQLLVDISELIQRDSRSGIQRVVKSILKEWLINPPDGYRVEAVYATPDRLGYYYARRFTLGFLGCPEHILDDEPVRYRNGDIFVGLDLNFFVAEAQKDYISDMQRTGVHVSYVIYDLLPIQFPEFWEEQHNIKMLHNNWLKTVTSYDSAICISKAVADELHDWLKKYGEPRKQPLHIGWFHLGADVENSNPTKGIPHDAEKALHQLQTQHSFLMVGTLEPRKGHQEVLAAFETLWHQNEKINLVFVGKKGWLVDDLVTKLKNHPQLNKKLFWLEGVSDEHLEKIYNVSTCLIAASYGEGFGLPLIEAAQHHLPIIARDIPVFREVAGNHAYYFNSQEKSTALTSTIKTWLEKFKKDTHPKPENMPWLTWKQSANELLRNYNLK